jgi:hypothetical protein
VSGRGERVRDLDTGLVSVLDGYPFVGPAANSRDGKFGGLGGGRHAQPAKSKAERSSSAALV